MNNPDTAGGASHGPTSTKLALLRAAEPLLPLLATGLVTSATTLFLVSAVLPKASPQPNLVVFDVDAAMARFVARPDVARLAPEDQAFSAAIQRFHAALDAEMARFAQSQDVVVLSANAILVGDAPDVTIALVDRVLDAGLSKNEFGN